MTIPTFDERRSAAIREGLEALVVPVASRRHIRWTGIAAIALASALAGGAVSAAVAVNLPPTIANPAPAPGQTGAPVGEGNPGIPAPAGTAPGVPVISLLGSAVSANVTGDADIALDPPAGATHVRVAVTCLTVGSTSWGLDASGNNPGSACAASDLVNPQAAWMDFPLTGTATLYVRAASTTSSIVTYQFTVQVETAWGVNARGQTFGAVKPGFGSPDLISVETPDGVSGYVSSQELADADGATAAESFDSPQDALDWQESREGKTVSIPVYESDGTTQVGQFVVGG